MERWEEIIDNYPDPPDIRYLTKLLQTASVVLKEDLANFEIEWILGTLLTKPVNLLAMISEKRTDSDWSKTNENSFKLLKEIVTSHYEHLTNYSEEIMKLCLLSYDAETRISAINCLSAMAGHFAFDPVIVKRQIHALDNSATCRAPLAALVGKICKFHPELVSEDFTTIWRIYLNMLDCNKNTIAVTKTVLQGIHDLFEYYGRELQTMELATFYDKMTKEFVQRPQCDVVCLSILENYCNLFREKLAKDSAILNFLWRKLSDGLSTKCVVNVYMEVLEVVKSDKNKLQQILTDILPRTLSTYSQVKYAALTIAHAVRTSCGVAVDIAYPDVQALEFELRSRAVKYREVYEIAFCIEASLPNSDKLLQTAVLFYDNLDAARRKEIVVNNIMKASDDLRTSTINFVITESCYDEASLEKHLPLWNDLAEHQNCDIMFSDVIRYTSFALRDLAEEDYEVLPPQVINLLTLCAHLISLLGENSRCREQCLVLVATSGGLPAAVWRQIALCAPREVPYQDFDILRCTDEQTLCDYCLIIINAPIECTDVDNMLAAFQIIFSRQDVEPKILSQALKKFETVMNTDKFNLNKTIVGEIIKSIEKLNLRKDFSGKDARVLHRDVVMFLGKYGTSAYSYLKDANHEINGLIMKLKDELVLNVPNPHEGTTYKINLHKLLRLALINENVDALKTLTTIIYANLSSNNTANTAVLQSAMWEAAVCICRATTRGDCTLQLPTAELPLAGGWRLLKHLQEERSPGVRKLLCGMIEELLTRHQGPDPDKAQELVKIVVEQAQIMLRSEYVPTKRAGLDLTQALINVLKEINSLAKRLLPKILVNLAQTKEYDVHVIFVDASTTFVEKIDIYRENEIDMVIDKLLEELLQDGGLNKMANDKSLKVFIKTVKIILEFIKNVYEIKNKEKRDLIERYFEIFEKLKANFSIHLYVLSELNRIFDFDEEMRKNVVTYSECLVIEKLFCTEMDNIFCMEAVLRFMEQYSDVLLELQYENTLKYLSNIKSFAPNSLVQLEKVFRSCLRNYTTKFKHTPKILLSSVEDWCNSIKLTHIIRALEKDCYTTEDAITAHSLKIMLNSVNTSDLSTLTDVKIETKKWPRILLKSFANGYLTRMTSKLTYLSDLLSITVKLSKSEVKNVILEGHNLQGVSNEKIGVKFARYFIDVFFERLIEPPYIMLEEDMATCCILLNDIVKYGLKKKCTDAQYDQILDLVDKLWPTYESRTSFSEKHTLLLDLTGLPRCLNRESNPMQWACTVIQSDAGREEKARLIGVLPGGKEYTPVYNAFASILPCRFSEFSGALNASLRALLDALAATADLRLLEIVMALAAGDATKGWWDAAIATCMSSVAAKAGLNLYKAVYTRCWGDTSMGVCNRVLVPLLRYSPSQKCSEFYSAVLQDLVPRLRKGYEADPPKVYFLKSVRHFTTALTIITLAFEKLPRTSIESPTSPLYKDLVEKVNSSFWLVRYACKWGGNLGSLVEIMMERNPSYDDDQVKEACRVFHCVQYNCTSAALCLYKPAPSKYENLLGITKWRRLVDCSRVYNLPLVGKWRRPTMSAPSSIAVQSRSTTLRTYTSARTPLFLRTLSECVLQYDLHQQESKDDVVTQELNLSETELNQHECAATLTSLWCHLSEVDSDWPEQLASALAGECHRNVKWLLAQAICNAREELKPQAGKLRPSLLAMISATAASQNGKMVVNGLHVDVLETLIFWSDDDPTPSQDLNTAVSLLLTSSLVNREGRGEALLNVADRLLSLYGRVVKVEWRIFAEYLDERHPDTPKVLKILKYVTKAGVYMPELLPFLLEKLSNTQYEMSALSELFGLALNSCENANGTSARREVEEAFCKFRCVLESKRSRGAEYVRMLYHAQMRYTGCCNEVGFRVITDLTSKMPTSDKKHCLKILSSYLSTNPPVEVVRDMFDSIDMCDVIMGDCSVEGFSVVKEGLRGLRGARRNALVMQVSGYCQHSVVKVRKAAMEVMLQAFKDLCQAPQNLDQPTLPKKPRTPLTTPILDAVEPNYNDVTTSTILKCVSMGLSDSDDVICADVRQAVAGSLYCDCMEVRFIESFILSIYLPIVRNCTSNISASRCVAAMFDLVISGLKGQERFRGVKLRDEPISMREYAFLEETNPGRSRVLTASKACVGTFRNTALSRSRRNIAAEDPNKTDIDVQITIESILDSLLQFMKQTPEASDAFLTSLTSCLSTTIPAFDARAVLAKLLSSALDSEPNALTPVVLNLVGSCVDSVAKENEIQQKLDHLKNLTLNSEATHHLTLLCEDVSLLNITCDGTLWSIQEDSSGDVCMAAGEFCLEDLKSIFGKLSNWDDLTTQQRKRVLNDGLPPLWTDKQTFVTALEDYSDKEGWFSKLVSAYKEEERQNSIKWLREVDKWPRKRFAISATTEAIEYLERLEENNTQFSCDIQPSDCLAEWAARFMMRTAYLTSLESDSPSEAQMLSRSHELKWCERANEMEISQCVLDCVKRNTADDLYKSETLSWLCQRVEALRTVGLQKEDHSLMDSALKLAETYAPNFFDDSPPESIIKISLLTLQLHQDLKKTTKENVQQVFDVVDRSLQSDVVMNQAFYKMAWSVCELALGYYDDCYLESTEKHKIITDMTEILERSIQSNSSKSHFVLCLILDKMAQLDGGPLNNETARKILDSVQLIHHNLNTFTTDTLKSHSHLFPSLSHAGYTFMSDREDELLTKYKKCFQVITDGQYTLAQYCDELCTALRRNDKDKWRTVFERMKQKIFENEYAGVDYLVLKKYKNKLYEICDFETTPSFKTKAESVLSSVRTHRPPRSTLRLDNLCPELGVGVVDTPAMASLLCLPRGVYVASFDNPVQVFTDSLRRPCVIRARLSNGTSRRYLIKPGECLKTDKAAVEVARAFGELAGARCTAYQITPLSEDCGLIEFIEDHERLRSVIRSRFDIDLALDTTQRPADDELIVAPLPASLRHHAALCDYVPIRLLRTAVNSDSVTIEDFWNRRINFTDSLAAYAVIGWILGLGDRHLQNILYSTSDSSVCLVDWNALFQYGVGEIPPARLTRNMLAVCDVQVLESRLQKLLKSLRDSHTVFLAVTKITFRWMGSQFEDKYPYIEAILKGKTRSCDVTRDAIDNSKMKFKSKYIELLDQVFGNGPVKDSYSVEEQISCLLQQCTDNRILAVTRSGWEPWI